MMHTCLTSMSPLQRSLHVGNTSPERPSLTTATNMKTKDDSSSPPQLSRPIAIDICAAPLSSQLHEKIPGNSQLIPKRYRMGLEKLFGCDLSDVRIIESKAPDQIGALAFAYGSTIFARHTADLFDSPRAWWLLGHEVTHILQQREGRASATSAPRTGLLHDPMLEEEANRMGEVTARAFQFGKFERGCYQASSTRTPGSIQPVIQCVMTLEAFKGLTKTTGIRFGKIASIDSELKAYHTLTAQRPPNFTKLNDAAKRVYRAAHAFRSDKPDSSRMPGVDALNKQIVLELAILGPLAAYETEPDDEEKFSHFSQAQDAFLKAKTSPEWENRWLESAIFTVKAAATTGAPTRRDLVAGVAHDIESLWAIGKRTDTPDILKAVIAECTAASNTQLLDLACMKPGLNYNTARGATQKYTLNHALDQDLGKRFRMGSLLHELTHLSIAETFANTVLMLAITPAASDAEILSLARSRNAKLHSLAAAIEANKAVFSELDQQVIVQNEVRYNRLYIEFKDKAVYPITGKFAGQYLRVFQAKMPADVHQRLTTLSTRGLDCELNEYDTVINQMFLWSHLYRMDHGCGVYTCLEALVREAYQYRSRARAMKSRPPAKPLPLPPSRGVGGPPRKPLPLPPAPK